MEHFTEFTILIVSLIVVAKLGSLLAGRIGLPASPFQVLIGIPLGPSLFNVLGAPVVLGTWGSISPSPLHGVLKVLAEIGLIQIMFLAGMKTDWIKLGKRTRAILNTGGWMFFLTAAVAAIAARSFSARWPEALAISATVAASSFGIAVYNMNEMKLLGSRVSTLSIGAAILSGLLAILLMIASLTANYAISFGAFRGAVALSWFLGKLVMFFAVAYFLTSRFLKLAARTGFHKSPWQILIGYLLLVAAIYAWAAMHFGSFAAVPVAALGGALLGTSALKGKEKIAEGLGSHLTSILIGILFIVLGMEVNLKEPGFNVFHFMALFLIVIASKWAGIWMGTRNVEDLSCQRVTCAAGTLAPGEVGILIAGYLFSRGLVNPQQFSLSIAAVVALTMTAPVLMKIAMKLPFQDSLCGIREQSHVK